MSHTQNPPEPPVPSPEPLDPPGPIHDPSSRPPLDVSTEDVALDQLILRPIHLDGLGVATVVDVVLSGSLKRVLGVDVVHKGCHRFLPWVALQARKSGLALGNTAALSQAGGLSLVLAFGTRLSETCHRHGLVVDRFGDIRCS